MKQAQVYSVCSKAEHLLDTTLPKWTKEKMDAGHESWYDYMSPMFEYIKDRYREVFNKAWPENIKNIKASKDYSKLSEIELRDICTVIVEITRWIEKQFDEVINISWHEYAYYEYIQSLKSIVSDIDDPNQKIFYDLYEMFTTNNYGGYMDLTLIRSLIKDTLRDWNEICKTLIGQEWL
jgi:hypothetical protein